jgi:signal transduction histidine kinase
MNQMFKSATFKLTLWYICLGEFISLIFSFLVYNIGSRQIYIGISEQSERIYQNFPIFDHNGLLKPDKDISRGDHELLLRIIFLNLFILLFAGLVSYLLAKRTLKPIEEAHEQQKRFTADVSHELRTPLTAIRMEDEVALFNEKTGKEELRKTLSSNLEEVSRLEGMINNLLMLSSLEANVLQQQFSEVNTKKVAKKALSEVKKKADQRGITVNSELIDAHLQGDAGSITQMLVIVLDNAIKYSSSGSKVELKTLKREGKIIFEVTDQGIGISKSALEHIFDRFYQAEASRNKKDNDGYGLGLSIAKHIADIHQAVINVTSQTGKGTTVDIIFSQN